MIYAIIALTIAVIYLWASKASLACVQHSCDTTNRTNKLYLAYMKPFAKEYHDLKGFNEMYMRQDSVEFQEKNGADPRYYIDYNRREVIKYEELEEKLEQLKADMKRGCEVYCKENNEKINLG